MLDSQHDRACRISLAPSACRCQWRLFARISFVRNCQRRARCDGMGPLRGSRVFGGQFNVESVRRAQRAAEHALSAGDALTVAHVLARPHEGCQFYGFDDLYTDEHHACDAALPWRAVRVWDLLLRVGEALGLARLEIPNSRRPTGPMLRAFLMPLMWRLAFASNFLTRILERRGLPRPGALPATGPLNPSIMQPSRADLRVS